MCGVLALCQLTLKISATRIISSDIWKLCFIYWTADLKSSELWSWQLRMQFKQLRIQEKPEKVRTSKGFEPVTSRYQCDALTNWADHSSLEELFPQDRNLTLFNLFDLKFWLFHFPIDAVPQFLSKLSFCTLQKVIDSNQEQTNTQHL